MCNQSHHWPHTPPEPVLLAGMASSDWGGNKTKPVGKPPDVLTLGAQQPLPASFFPSASTEQTANVGKHQGGNCS